MTPIPIIQSLLVISRTVRSTRSAPGENDQWSPQQDLQVQPQRPVFDIRQVKLDHLVEIEDRPTTHLPQTSETWRNRESAKLARAIFGNFVGQRWPWADQAHLPAQHVEQLRQLVQAQPPQDAPEWRDPRVIAQLEGVPG